MLRLRWIPVELGLVLTLIWFSISDNWVGSLLLGGAWIAVIAVYIARRMRRDSVVPRR